VNPVLTQGIILSRTDFGEADRIITVLTPDQGKLRLMAKGVRKVKSKLAGGIELFSVSDITFIRGKREIGTLVSSRLQTHYGQIINDIERVQLGYDLIKTLNKATEDEPEVEYFDLLNEAFSALDNKEISLQLIRLWFLAQLLKLAGHTPNLKTDTSGHKLDENQKYNFDIEAMTFIPQGAGRFKAGHIKFLRLAFSPHKPSALNQIQGLDRLLPAMSPLVQAMQQTHIRA
jgi:DNA repair protein RecO (recombination protein O)